VTDQLNWNPDVLLSIFLSRQRLSYNDPRAPPQVGRNSPTSDTLELNGRIYLPRVAPPIYCQQNPSFCSIFPA
jgi:hypothetical protein